MNAAATATPIRVRGLTHRYGPKLALDNLEFELPAGEFLALLGPNGSGKTTLFSVLTRLLAPQAGSVDLFGRPLDRAPGKALGKLGVVFQQPTLDLDLTVEQNLLYHGALQGMSSRAVRARARHELGRFNLQDRAKERVRTLNGGHRRRVEIARALLHNPELLLLDEASAGLDYETRRALYQHVRALCDDQGLAVLWTTHLVEELDPRDQTLVLKQGRIVARGTIDSLRTAHGRGDGTGAGSEDINSALLALTSSGKP